MITDMMTVAADAADATTVAVAGTMITDMMTEIPVAADVASVVAGTMFDDATTVTAVVEAASMTGATCKDVQATRLQTMMTSQQSLTPRRQPRRQQTTRLMSPSMTLALTQPSAVETRVLALSEMLQPQPRHRRRLLRTQCSICLQALQPHQWSSSQRKHNHHQPIHSTRSVRHQHLPQPQLPRQRLPQMTSLV